MLGKQLIENLSNNAIPETLVNSTHEDFFKFMDERRTLMALLVKEYYQAL